MTKRCRCPEGWPRHRYWWLTDTCNWQYYGVEVLRGHTGDCPLMDERIEVRVFDAPRRRKVLT